MAMVCLSLLVLTGCTEEEMEDLAKAETDSIGTDAVQPQGNQRDYLIQDYNVKKVEDVKIPSLKKYDVSGPDYSGISEIGGSIASTEMMDESTNGVCLSTYHRKATSGSHVWQGYVCTKKDDTSEVVNALSATAFYRNGDYDSSTDVNALLKDAQAFINSNTPSTSNDRSELSGVLTSLRTSGAITPGYESVGARYYKVEKDACNIIASSLKDADIESVITDSSENSGLTFVEMTEYAASSGATAHVIVTYNQAQLSSYTNTNGWVVYYRESGSGSKELADAIYKSLKKEGSLIEAKSENGSEKFKGERSVEEYYGNSYKFPALVYASIPTVIVSIHATDASDTKVAVTAKAITSGIQEWKGGD